MLTQFDDFHTVTVWGLLRGLETFYQVVDYVPDIGYRQVTVLLVLCFYCIMFLFVFECVVCMCVGVRCVEGDILVTE